MTAPVVHTQAYTPAKLAKLSADEFVAQREAAENAQRLADDLAAAPKADQDLLAAEQARLATLEAAMDAANAAAQAARSGIVDARVSGRSDESARAVATEADRVAFEAMRECGLQRDVVSQLRDKILAAVRADREARAKAKQADALERWDAAIARIVPAFEAVESLRVAHALDLEAADELAYARGEYGTKFDADGFRARSGPNGQPYRTTPEAAVSILLDGQPILTAGELVARLRARP